MEEYGAYQKFWNATDPDEKIRLSEDFLLKYPESELKTFAYRKEMEAYQQKDDFERMRKLGEKVLEADPDDVIALILLASAIPERTFETDLDKDQKLNVAESYAKRALVAIEKVGKSSPQITDQQWEQLRNLARSQSYAALGLVNLQRRNYAEAEESFRKATRLNPQPDPILAFRTGLALWFSKKYEESLAGLNKCVEMGGVKLKGRDLCVEQRDVLQRFLDQRKAAGPPPAAPGQTPSPKPPQ